MFLTCRIKTSFSYEYSVCLDFFSKVMHGRCWIFKWHIFLCQQFELKYFVYIDFSKNFTWNGVWKLKFIFICYLSFLIFEIQINKFKNIRIEKYSREFSSLSFVEIFYWNTIKNVWKGKEDNAISIDQHE